jgi:hypothetical protein
MVGEGKGGWSRGGAKVRLAVHWSCARSQANASSCIAASNLCGLRLSVVRPTQSGIRFHRPDYPVDLVWRDTGAGTGSARGRIG